MKRRILGFVLLLVLSVLGSGCCEQVPVFPVGAYVADADGQDYVLDFSRYGTYSAVLAGRALITKGHYRCAGNAVTFAADPPCASEATYQWTLQDHTLTFFVKGEDRCVDRRERLQNTIYTCITCT